MRCVKDDHTAINMTLHYLDNGTVMLNFIYQKELFFLPLGFALKVRCVFTSTIIKYCWSEVSTQRCALVSRLWWTSQTSTSTKS